MSHFVPGFGPFGDMPLMNSAGTGIALESRSHFEKFASVEGGRSGHRWSVLVCVSLLRCCVVALLCRAAPGLHEAIASAADRLHLL